MTSKVMNMVAQKVLKDAAKTNLNAKDPYFDSVEVVDKRGNPTGKTNQVRKGRPVGLTSDHDWKILKTVRKRAYRFDRAVSLCGFKLGWGAIIGLIPVVGDVLDCLMAYIFVYRKAQQIEGGLPTAIQTRMLLNIVMDFCVGLVPFIGDIADAMFKANSRNAWLLEEYLINQARLGQEKTPAKVEEILSQPAPAPVRVQDDTPYRGDPEMGIINQDRTPAANRN